MFDRLRLPVLIGTLAGGALFASNVPADTPTPSGGQQASSEGKQPASDEKPAASAGKPARTSRWPRVRLGGIYVGAGYSRFSGGPFYPGYYYPGYYAYRPWAWSPFGWPYAYDPFFYGPYLHPGFLTGFGYGPNMGEIKLRSSDKEAWVYLDGALAGKVEKLKSMWLEPGAYNLEVRSGDHKFGQRVYVLSGRTLKLTADLERAEVRP
jgi:hypothetical protein